jgi:tetratricopeptide (TPR) repeat protein
MKRIFCIVVMACACQVLFAQKGLNPGLEMIKTGNTLREAGLYDQSEEMLLAGLKQVEKSNKYWEASAYEALGLLYRDHGLTQQSIVHFNKAIALYQELKSQANILAVTALKESVEEKESLYAGIEIGAKGVKMSVIGVRLTHGGFYDFTLKKDLSENPNIVTMQEENIQQAIKHINQFVEIAKKTYQLTDDKIFLVASSGVRQEAQKAGKLAELTEKIEQGFVLKGRKLTFITPEQEAMYAIRGTTLPRFRATSSTVDIGSGNTKGGFLTGEKLERVEPFSMPFGTESFFRYIESQKLDRLLGFDSLARLMEKDFIIPAVRKELDGKSGLRTRQLVHLIGGIAWATTTLLYPEQINEAFVPVAPAQIKKLKEALIANYEIVTVPNLDFITDPAVRKKAQQELDAVKKSFNREELIAGAIILDAITTYLNNQQPAKRFVYARYGYIGWISGFVFDHVSEAYAKAIKKP